MFETEIDNVRSGGEADYYLLQSLADYFSLFPDELHHKKEDIIYDALVEKMAAKTPNAAERFHNLRSDHEKLTEAAERFKEEVAKSSIDPQSDNSALASAASAFVSVQQRHMNSEEQHFFPRVLAMFDDEDWENVNAAYADLLGDAVNMDKAKRVFALEDALLSRVGDV